MDLGIIGLFDILIIIGFGIAVFIGLRKGFITSFLDIASGIFGFIIAIIITKPTADFLYHHFTPLKNAIYNAVEPNVIARIGTEENVAEALTPLKLPGFLNELIIDYYNRLPEGSHTLIQDVTNAFTYVLIILLSFVFLCIFLTLGIMLIKKLVHMIREGNRLFKLIDGFLGVILGVVIFFVALYVFLLIIALLLQFGGGLGSFIETDMQLLTERFRLSKFFYNNNLVGNLLKLFI